MYLDDASMCSNILKYRTFQVGWCTVRTCGIESTNPEGITKSCRHFNQNLWHWVHNFLTNSCRYLSQDLWHWVHNSLTKSCWHFGQNLCYCVHKSLAKLCGYLIQNLWHWVHNSLIKSCGFFGLYIGQVLSQTCKF